MIRLDIEIPIITKDDVTDPDKLEQLLTIMKQVVEDIASKAKQMQMEVRSDAPSSDDLEEGSSVRATVGGNHYIYTKKDGTIYRWQIT